MKTNGKTDIVFINPIQLEKYLLFYMYLIITYIKRTRHKWFERKLKKSFKFRHHFNYKYSIICTKIIVLC